MGSQGPFACSEGGKFLVLTPLKLVERGDPGLDTENKNLIKAQSITLQNNAPCSFVTRRILVFELN